MLWPLLEEGGRERIGDEVGEHLPISRVSSQVLAKVRDMHDRINAEVAACQLDAALTDKQVGELRQARAFWDACDSSEPLPFPSDERAILTQFEKHVRAALKRFARCILLRGAGLSSSCLIPTY
jgi:hypothetical protein